MLIFVLQGFNQETPEGRLVDYVKVELIGKSYEETLKRAKKIITKKFWRLSDVIEKDEHTS